MYKKFYNNVLKNKIIKIIFFLFLTIVLFSLISFAIGESFDYFTKDRHIKNIAVNISAPENGCGDLIHVKTTSGKDLSFRMPVEITIMNNSTKTIINSTIYPNANLKGYSRNLLESYSLAMTDKIIKPGEKFVFCYKGDVRGEILREYRPSELEWNISNSYFELVGSEKERLDR